MKINKIVSIALSGIFVMTMLVGCGNDATSASNTNNSISSESKSSDEQVTLRFSWWGGDARHKATLEVIEAFEKEYPNIKIEAEYSSYDGYAEKKTTEFASNTAPDIFQIETGLGPEYYKQGMLYNLSETSIDFSDFNPSFLESNGQFGTGSQYAIPTGQSGTALLVNKTLADEVGVDFSQPYDWDDLLDYGKKVKEYNPDYYLLSLNTTYAMPFFVRAWARQANGDGIINDETKELNMTVEQFEECFTLIQALYENGVAAPASYKAPFGENEQEDPNWIEGKYVASACYGSTVTIMSSVNEDLEYMAGQLPLMSDRKSDGWFNDTPQYMGLYSKSKNPEEAALFLDYFFNNDGAAKTLGTVRSVPPTNSAKVICEEEGLLDSITAQTVNVSAQYNGMSDAGFTTGSEVNAILKDSYDNIAYGTKTPKEAAEEVVSLLNDFLSTK